MNLRSPFSRDGMSQELHALRFLAGAYNIFLGERLLTADNPGDSSDDAMLQSLGMTIATAPLQA